MVSPVHNDLEALILCILCEIVHVVVVGDDLLNENFKHPWNYWRHKIEAIRGTRFEPQLKLVSNLLRGARENKMPALLQA